VSVFNLQKICVSLILIVLILITYSYGGLTKVSSQEIDWNIHKYVYEEGEESFPINYKAFSIVVTNPQLVDKVEDIVPKRYWAGSNPPPDVIEDYDENNYKLIWYIDREEAENCCSQPISQLSPECIIKGYSKNLQGECILLIILYFYNPDENDVEICNTATAEGDDIHNPGEKITKSSENPCVIIPGYTGPSLAEPPCPLPGIPLMYCFQAKIGDCVVTNEDGTPITFTAFNYEIFFTPNPYRDEEYCLDLYNGGPIIVAPVHIPETGENYLKPMLFTDLCLSAPQSKDYQSILEQVRRNPGGYMRDGEYHECDIVRPDIPARDSSGEQIDSKGVLALLYEITADIKDQIPNGEFVRLNTVPCPEEKDESANDFSDVAGLDCNDDGEVDIPIDNPYNEEP